MSFGENLQTIRKKNRLSQEGLAEMLGVSRQAVSKWELGEGYPEVDKLLILSKKLNISIDSLLGGENVTTNSEEGKPSGTIRIISPYEGVIINASKVTRSQQFKGGKNSPKFTLFASDGNDLSFWGAQNTFLAWYRNLEEVTRELVEIQKALDTGAASYTLQYSVRVIALGGKPEYGFVPQEIHNDPKELLERWYKEFTEGGIASMNRLAANLCDDAITRKMVEEFVAGEEEHYAWVAKHLAIIEKLGYDNYLLEMMDI